ncbi:hypothetical protein [Tardiphaga sp.]|uniref:hypothetical protein n=1 Tax=Tardiphaga sp. TaxID=1926292 RepID=UPI002631C1C3|nr:hypothetical protein [Tardiphaga sp.]MDB5616254.1 hypothetical protein [Tardiphaga sp.]
MADDRDKWANPLSAEPAGGWTTGFLAEEDSFDRKTLWRLGSWGTGAVAAVIVAILAAQSQSQQRREQTASTELLARQSQQIQFVAKETQNEARRLSQAIETLNSDRDRLYSRVTSMEQGLESVTGSIKRQTVAAATPAPAPAVVALPSAALSAVTVEPVPHIAAVPPPPAPPPLAPVVAPVAAVPLPAETPRPSAAAAIAAAPALMTAKSLMAPPDAAASKLSEPPAKPEPAPAATAAPETTASIQAAAPEPVAIAEPAAVPVPRTEFGVDLGGAYSVDGLRAMWLGLAHNKELTGLRPIMTVKERSGSYGMQLRLIAGPLTDAAAAARLCATLIERKRPCETSVFDGQRLALKSDAPQDTTPARPAPRKRATAKPERIIERALPPPQEEPAPAPKPAPSLTSILGIR